MNSCILAVLSEWLLRSRLRGTVKAVAVLTVLNLLWSLAIAQSTGINGGGPNGGGGGGTPGGSNHQIQVNNSGTFGGIANGTAGQVLTSNGTGSNPSFQNAAGGSPGSPTNSVQFNLGGAFTGSSNFLWDNTNAALALTGPLGGILQSISGGTLNVAGGNAITDLTNSACIFGGGGGVSGNGGSISCSAGPAATSGSGGSISIGAGNGIGTNQNGGSVSISAGVSTGSAVNGTVSFGTHGLTRFLIEENGSWALNGVGNSGDLLTSNGPTGAPTWTTLSLASLVNQGTTTTVLHGNAAGSLSFSAVNLATDTTGTLSLANIATCSAAQILFASSSTAAACSSKFTWTDSTDALVLGNPSDAVTIGTPAATSGAAGALAISTGAGNGSGAGGAFSFTSGIGGTTGAGGAFNLTAGHGGSTSGAGGKMTFSAGAAGPGGNATGGDFTMAAGKSAGTAQGGAFQMTAGAGGTGSTGAGGTVQLNGGTGGTGGGAGGEVDIFGGNANSTGVAGNVVLSGGSHATTSRAGSVILADKAFDNSLMVNSVGHVSYASPAPVVSACGTTPSVDAHANDTAGTITVGSGVVASCTLTFHVAFTTWVHCRVTAQSSIASFAYSYTTSAITITGTSLTSDLIDYSCDGS